MRELSNTRGMLFVYLSEVIPYYTQKFLPLFHKLQLTATSTPVSCTEVKADDAKMRYDWLTVQSPARGYSFKRGDGILVKSPETFIYKRVDSR